MYETVPDPYCYPGSDVLRNLRGITDQSALEVYEAMSTAQRAEEAFPDGRLSVSHYKAFHYHLFQDVYRWAGRYRTVRISKDGSAFCYPEYIQREMKALFLWLRNNHFLRGLDNEAFCIKGAHFLTVLNAIHPFREGNGRTQTAFMTLIASRAGHPFDLEALDPATFLPAMIRSFQGEEKPLVRELRKLVA